MSSKISPYLGNWFPGNWFPGIYPSDTRPEFKMCGGASKTSVCFSLELNLSTPI